MRPDGIETVVGDVFTRRIACYAEISRMKRQLSADHQLAGKDLMTKQQYQFPWYGEGKFALFQTTSHQATCPAVAHRVERSEYPVLDKPV